jgi:hypothetical protein
MKMMRLLWVSVVGIGCICLVGCGGSSHPSTASSTPPNTVTTTGQNVLPIAVSGGPDLNYVDAAFASVTVCVPGTSTCQTINNLLVDTGSVGLRIVSSELTTVGLPQQKASDGNAVAECLQFLGSYTWGPVQTADLQIAGEKASSIPIQVLSDTDFVVPSSCTSIGPSADTVASLQANGILGVGQFPQDCGGACALAPSTSANPTQNPNLYFECASASATCQPISEATAQQVQNPVALFASDNNGVIVELPTVSGAETTVSGSLVFGIGTQSNNSLGSATVYTADPQTGNFTTVFNGTTYTDTSFLDSGSNGLFFVDSGITQCSDGSGFYCPSSTVNLSATNQGITAGSGVVNFSIQNADSLFSHASDFALGGLGGTMTPSNGVTFFDWGLPFFFGRNVYTSIEGTSAPGGATPYWAY